MKTMKKSIVFLIIIILGIASAVDAQTSENSQRERDNNIAGGILTEMFEDEDSGDILLSGFQTISVYGEYIPGYGVHLTISPGSSRFVFHELQTRGDNEGRVEISGDSSSESYNGGREDVQERIVEYMSRYAALISGVADNETVRVTYTPNRSSSMNWRFMNENNHTQKSSPGVSVWARMGDLKSFREGDISEQELMSRIETHILNSDENYKDFNVFASVLETALNSVDTEYLRVARKPQMEYLPGLGVRYRVQVSTKPSIILDDIHFLDGDFEFRMDSLRINLDESLRLMEESLHPLMLRLDSMFDLNLSDEEREQLRRELNEQRSDIRIQRDSLRNSMQPPSPPSSPTPPARANSADLQPEADAIMDELLSVIKTYGSTLASLSDDEMLMISVNWSGRTDELPKRTEVRIKKSDLLNGDEPDIEEIKRR